VVPDPAYRSSAFRGFQHQRNFAFWVRDPRNPEGDVASWDPGVSGRQVSCSRSFGVRGFMLYESHNTITADFPIGGSPRRKGR
jgi:hypothetical protein